MYSDKQEILVQTRQKEYDTKVVSDLHRSLHTLTHPRSSRPADLSLMPLEKTRVARLFFWKLCSRILGSRMSRFGFRAPSVLRHWVFNLHSLGSADLEWDYTTELHGAIVTLPCCSLLKAELCHPTSYRLDPSLPGVTMPLSTGRPKETDMGLAYHNWMLGNSMCSITLQTTSGITGQHHKGQVR